MKLCPSCGNMNPDDATSCLRCQAAMEDEAPGSQAPSPGGGSFSPGTTLGDGRYLLESHLGEGGMGNVFLAKDTRLGRTLALKILSAALVGHSQAWSRMDREGKALALIDHANVVRIHDIFDEGPFLVLALEYVPGGDLRSRAEAGRLETTEIVRLMGGMLDGLTAIHEAGFVHRDMKPGNVLLTESDVPKIADLGVAHESQGRSMTRTGTQLGTPEYMAPEQVEGKKVDARTDLYACGIILFELLSGQVPFAGDSDYAIFHGHVQTEPDLDLLSEAPSHLLTVVQRALAKDPEERWPSAAAMAQALRSEVEVEPSPRPVPVSPPEPTAPEVKPPTHETPAEAPSPTGPTPAAGGSVIDRLKAAFKGRTSLLSYRLLSAIVLMVAWLSQYDSLDLLRYYSFEDALEIALFVFTVPYYFLVYDDLSAWRATVAMVEVAIVVLSVRRARDAGLTPWLGPLTLAPYIGPLLWITLCVKKGEVEPPDAGGWREQLMNAEPVLWTRGTTSRGPWLAVLLGTLYLMYAPCGLLEWMYPDSALLLLLEFARSEGHVMPHVGHWFDHLVWGLPH